MTNNIILLEGIDGCGKSTAVELIKQIAQGNGQTVKTFRDPGSTVLGEEIRKLVANRSMPIVPMAQTMLFMATRAQLMAEISEEVDQYDLIIVDRLWPSTIAYQCFGGSVPRDFVFDSVRALESEFPRAAIPVSNRFCLLIDPEVAHQRRMSDVERAQERFKAANMAFKQRVADGYSWLVDQGYLSAVPAGVFNADELAQLIYRRWSGE